MSLTGDALINLVTISHLFATGLVCEGTAEGEARFSAPGKAVSGLKTNSLGRLGLVWSKH